jgi:hypothetical protein
MASKDGKNFVGVGVTGETSGEVEMLHLSDVPGLGNVTGSTQVWIAFLFESDANTTSDKGAFVDDVTLTKQQIAGTPIAGLISGTLPHIVNPYIAVGDVWVLQGDSLKIDPGVEIRFDGPYEFIVAGKLTAEGAKGDSIIFTSNKDIPKTGDWLGIGLYGTEKSIIKYSIIKHTGAFDYNYDYHAGIYSQEAENDILNTLIDKGRMGIEVGSGNILVSGSKISNNQYDGMYSGIYFIEMKADKFQSIRKAILLK